MSKGLSVKRTAAGDEAISAGGLDRKSLNVLRMVSADMDVAIFRRNLKRYGDIDALIENLIHLGYLERTGRAAKAPRGWRLKLQKTLGGVRPEAADKSANTDALVDEPDTEPPILEDIVGPGESLTALPLPQVNEGFDLSELELVAPADDDNPDAAEESTAELVAALEPGPEPTLEAAPQTAPITEGKDAPTIAEPADPLEDWQTNEASDTEASFVEKYTSLLK